MVIPHPTKTFAVIEFPGGYVFHLAAGNAVPANGEVGLTTAYPGAYWNVAPIEEYPDSSIYA